MRLFARREGVPADVLERAGLARGEKVLAHTVTDDGTWLLGTRGLLAVVDPVETRLIPWERVEDAAWDQEASRLKVTEIGSYGDLRPVHAFDLQDPALLLQLLRERVTASIVLQRRVPVRGKQGLTVIGRRSPVGGPVIWMNAYDAGLDPDDPEVVMVADRAVADARAEVGDDVDHPI
ncbi:MAG: hypothetical protein JWR90_199 [Marmoricola sp.]|nr:hypothetical protein [Marmoricola sp.]